MYKSLADSTLLSMTKKEIIGLLRTAEHNAEASQERLAQQADNMKNWQPVVHGYWKRNVYGRWECSHCGANENKHTAIKGGYCWRCGALMDLERFEKDGDNQ